MFYKLGLAAGIALTSLVLSSLSTRAQTTQQGSQDAYIQGSNNEVNQIINQYHLANPGKGVLKRKEPLAGSSNPQQSSLNRNRQTEPSNNRDWGRNQGQQRRHPKN